jgi:hypothetical protein
LSTWRVIVRGFVPAALSVLAAAGCTSDGEVAGDVLESVKSADGSAVAKVAKTGHGATVSDVYRVYLENGETGEAAEILRADHVESIKLAWTGNDVLTISMPCGRVFAFQNFVDILQRDGSLRGTMQMKLETSGLCPR